ncbi:MAG: BamA/TamA family outer membrane protein [Flavobacteriaceae bacterium]|nr:BamA/TamA family outer membrane protein [Flavobacteriaceae bacterium]MCY4253317.1 BamA/TamA family outer membrane protein [Flavobacteriaceae bacterium]
MFSFRIIGKIGVITIVLIISNCSVTKHLSEDQLLIMNQSLVVDNQTVKNHDPIDLSVNAPNKRFLNIPFGLHLYNLASTNSDEKFESWLNKRPKRLNRVHRLISPKQVETIKNYKSSFNNWLKNAGEAPKLIDSLSLEYIREEIRAYYNNYGFLDAEVSYTIQPFDTSKANLNFIVHTNDQYFLDAVDYQSISPELDTLLKHSSDLSLIKKGDPLRFSDLQEERRRIVNYLRNNGVYNYQQNSIRFELGIDSLNHELYLPLKIDLGGFQKRASNFSDYLLEPYVPYKIGKIDVYINRVDSAIGTSEDLNSLEYGDFTIYSRGKLKYKPSTLTRGIEIKLDSLYRDVDRNETLRYYTSLENFKYPRIDFIPDPNKERSLISSINLTPKDRFRLGIEFDVSTSQVQDFGIGSIVSFEVRNVFRGAEILRLSFDNTIGSSSDIPTPSDEFFNLYEVGANLSMEIPRIFFPIRFNRLIPPKMLPQTNILFGTSIQRNIGLDKQFYDAVYSFQWNPNSNTSISFSLLDFEYVNNQNIDNFFNVYTNTYQRVNAIAESYDDFSEYKNQGGDLEIPRGVLGFLNTSTNPSMESFFRDNHFRVLNNLKERYDRLVSNNLILGSSLNINYSTQENFADEHFFQIRGGLDWVGTILNDIVLRNRRNSINDQGKYEWGGVEPSQFIKIELDVVKRWSLGSRQVLALRLFNGIAIPFGNSNNIPFAESYFAGGTNDNRAWRVYSLGPGTNQTQQELNEANFKLFSSLEYRYPILGGLHGAFFLDVGNIWNTLDDVDDPSLRFDGFSDLSELAVGVGLGLRYDFRFFVLRLDTGFKAHDPAQDIGQRWWSGLSLDQAVFNIGINYPF